MYRFPVRDQEIKNGAQRLCESPVCCIVHGTSRRRVWPGSLTIEGAQPSLPTGRVEAWLNSPLSLKFLFVNTKHFRSEVGHANPYDARRGLWHGRLALLNLCAGAYPLSDQQIACTNAIRNLRHRSPFYLLCHRVF